MGIAALILLAQGLSLKPGAPVLNFAAVSVSNVLATTCQYEALKYVSFPVQTLGKCAKMVPVMVWGRLISGKKYLLDDYAVALVVMLGCTAFLLAGETKSRVSAHQSDAFASVVGLTLMVGYLGFDGFTSTFQDKLFKGYQMETYNQMLWVTFWSSLISVGYSLANNTLGDALAFVSRHPDCLQDIIWLSLSATLGQLIILYTIKEFGALLFATVMTTRQLLSILLSCIIFPKPLSPTQWAGAFSVFAALYYQSFTKKKSKGSSSTAPSSQPEPPSSSDQAKDPEAGVKDAGANSELPPSTSPSNEAEQNNTASSRHNSA